MAYKMITECPKCGNEDIHNADSGFEPESAWLLRQCDECKEEWYEVYLFSWCENLHGEKLPIDKTN
jgi:ribosomal protein S27E